MDKSPDAFRTISEVAGDLDLPQHVLRFWETRFVQIKPLKRGGGRRYYRPDDVDLLKGIRHLLYGEGYTIRGVQRILKEQGVRFVQEVWREGAPQPPPAGARWDAEPGFDRLAAETAADAWAPGEDEPALFDETPEADEVVREIAHERDPAGDGSDDEVFAPAPTPSAPVASAPTIRTPFSIGRATPVDPGMLRRPASDDDDGRAAPPAEPQPRLRADRIADFAAQPPRAPEVEAPPVELDPPPVGEPPLDMNAARAARLTVTPRPAAPPPESPRGGLGHLFDRLRPTQGAAAPDLGRDTAPATAPRGAAAAGLSREEIRRLQSTLFELLECKRILDQAR